MLIQQQQQPELIWGVTSSDSEWSRLPTLCCHVRSYCDRSWCRRPWHSLSVTVSRALTLLPTRAPTAQSQQIHCRSDVCLAVFFAVRVQLILILTDWLTECFLLWHLANCRWYYNGYIHKCYSLHSKRYSLQYTMYELVWIFVQHPHNEVTDTQVSLVFMQLSVMHAASEVILLWCCGLQWK